MPRAKKTAKGQPVENAHLPALRKRVAKAPTGPGVYRWMNKEGTVLYVGKAKNLRNRLRSYVSPARGAAEGPWKRSFLRQIADFDVTVTNTEMEALIFETNQIKELRPKYNVLMKDDKNYVYARITVQDPYPRVESVRRIEQDGAKYFGPMSTGGELWAMLTMLRSIFPFRVCKMEIEPKDSVSSALPLDVVCHHKDRPTPCLDAHIEKCSAPCTGARTPQQYVAESIDGVVRFLKGDYESVRPLFQERMQKAAADKKFELAAQLRDYLQALDRLQGKQLVSDTSGEDSDIIAVAVLSLRADVVVLRRRGGRLTEDLSFSLAGQAESAVEVLQQFLPQFYGEGAEVPEQVIVSEELPDAEMFAKWLSQRKGRKVQVLLPSRGRKSHLLQLAEKNVREKSRQRELKWEAEQRNTEGALEDLQRLLSLPSLPKRIEGYDISHLGGTETVGSMVVAKDGKAANDQYRSFTVRSLQSGEVDDYKALQEVLGRRLLRLTRNVREEEKRLKEEGITFGLPRASERPLIAEQLNRFSESPVRDTLVVRRNGTLAGVIWIVERESGVLQLLHPAFPGGNEIIHDMPDYIFHRKLLSRAKKKIYVVLNSLTAETFAALGFRYVQQAPASLAKAAASNNMLTDEWIAQNGKEFSGETIVMVFDPKANRSDPSLQAKPDLLVIDGGKGQLSAVHKVLGSLKLTIPVIGLAKREEEVFVAGQPHPVPFPPDSPAKFLLMRLRDEAHRFANRHREQRGKKSSQASMLDGVPGIGPETRRALLKKFGSITSIREASDAELSVVLTDLQLRELRRRV